MILSACTESIILSEHAESIIVSAPPAESMILSAPPKQQWATPAAQWVAGCKAIALGDGTAVARWMAQCYWSVGQSNFLYWVVAKIGPDGFCPIPDSVQIWSRSGPDRGTWLSRSKNLDSMSGHAVQILDWSRPFWTGPERIFLRM